MIDANFTEICKDVRINAFGVCCPVENKVITYPRRMLMLPLARDIIPSLLALSLGSP